jgi:hypothetical protein
MIQQINFKSNQNDTQANKQAQKGSKLLWLDKSEGVRGWVEGLQCSEWRKGVVGNDLWRNERRKEGSVSR